MATSPEPESCCSISVCPGCLDPREVHRLFGNGCCDDRIDETAESELRCGGDRQTGGFAGDMGKGSRSDGSDGDVGRFNEPDAPGRRCPLPFHSVSGKISPSARA